MTTWRKIAGAYCCRAGMWYLHSRFGPGIILAGCGAVFYGFLFAFLRLRYIYDEPFRLAITGVFWCMVCAAAGVLGAMAFAFWRKAWRQLVWQAISLVAVLLLFTAGAAAFIALALFGPNVDHFADDLTIPEHLSYGELEKAPPLFDFQLAAAEDSGQRRLGAALRRPGRSGAIATGMPNLTRLSEEFPELLWRYLAASPAWRLAEERGKWYAVRRFEFNGEWHSTLNGYCANLFSTESADNYFQFRVALDLDRVPSLGRNHQELKLPTDTVRVRRHGMDFTSSVLIPAGSMLVQIFEQTRFADRRLTPAAMARIEEEAALLLRERDVRGGMRGEPRIRLRQSYQTGIYDAFVYCNPGAPGSIYLKAFEVTRGTPLSAGRLREHSMERIGFSKEPGELFFGNSTFTIYEGDWGKPYAARFEVWFVPADGGPERKLLEENFQIEGWQR